MTAQPSPILVDAVKKILRPMVRVLLTHGLTYTWLSGLLKPIFVEVAMQDFRVPGKAQTDSRITLLTGVHRKDVKRLREEHTSNGQIPANVSLGAQLVSVWLSDKNYLGKSGHPKPLPRLARGNEKSFEDLVASVSKDIRPRAVLDEWLRLGAVEIDEHDCVCLRSEAFIPAKGFDEKAYYFGQNVHDHMAAAAHNVLDQQPPFLERSVFYESLSGHSIATLAKLAEKQGTEILQILNSKARELQTEDGDGTKATQRMNFGIYFFSTDDQADTSTPD